MTYHWHNGEGYPPGTIALRSHDGTVLGPWRATARSLPDTSAPSYWECRPQVVLEPGTYTIVDSHHGSWAWNENSGGGIAVVKGVALDQDR